MTASHQPSTERKRAGETQDFRYMLHVLPSAAYTTDAEGLITDFNCRAVELWGREPKRNDPLDRY